MPDTMSIATTLPAHTKNQCQTARCPTLNLKFSPLSMGVSIALWRICVPNPTKMGSRAVGH